MFEGKPPIAPDAHISATGKAPGEELCQLSWSDLVAKLAAARDLRVALAHHDDLAPASFDAGSARHLALHHDLLRQDESERGVNPDDLGNGKGVYGKQLSGAGHKQPAIRGNA